MAVLSNNTLVEPNVVLPTLNFSPLAGPLGTEVLLSGTAFTKPVSVVRFNGVGASRFPDPNNPSNVIAIVPAGATDGPIQVTFSDGSSVTSLGDFDVLPGIANPKIRSFFPTAGAVGTTVQLDGSGFTQAESVSFGGVLCTQFLVQGDVNILAVVPAGAQDGPIRVRRGGAEGMSSANFDVTQAGLSISGFSPNSGTSGITVDITGSGFLGVDTVLFGNLVSQPFSVINDGLIRATVPAGLAGQSVSITVKEGSQQANSGNLLFTFADTAPSISGFSPLAGAVGTEVTITGTNLGQTTQVRFAGTLASFTILGPTALRAIVPSGAADGFITALVGGLSIASSAIFDVLSEPFSLLSLSPSSGPSGTVVTINGTNLLGADTVLVGGVSVPFTLLNASQIRITMPNGAPGSVAAVQVRKAGIPASGNLFFAYAAAAAPQITALSPQSGAVGTAVAIVGSGLIGVDVVRFGGVNAAFTILSDTQIRATVPAGAMDGFVTVDDNGRIGQSPTIFDVTDATFSVQSIAPGSGPVGTNVTIKGSGFTGVDSVTFGGVQATFTVLDAVTITAVVPLNKVGGTVAVQVSKAGTPAAGSLSFTYATGGLSITNITPNPASSGSIVRVLGSGFANATQVRIGRFIIPFTLISDNEIRITASITGNVVVITPTATVTSSMVLTVI